MMKKISKNMVIADIIAVDEGIIPFLIQAGMHCVGCPSAQGETLEELKAHLRDLQEVFSSDELEGVRHESELELA